MRSAAGMAGRYRRVFDLSKVAPIAESCKLLITQIRLSKHLLA